MKNIHIFGLLVVVLTMVSCGGVKEPAASVNELPKIFPDYIGVMVPRNIAPINFGVDGATDMVVRFTTGDKEEVVTGDDYIDIDREVWHSLIEWALKSDGRIGVDVAVWDENHPEGVRYKKFYITASPDEVDHYLAYRLIPPGYESWNTMGIFQRDLSSFDEKAIVKNSQNHNGCVNCHSFANYNSAKGMMFHARGKGGGTVLYSEDKGLRKIALESLGPQRSGTYPMWHPSGKYIVLSSNVTRQSFYGHSLDKIEVYDQMSDLIIYDVERNDVIADQRFTDSLNWETFPAFSPDGKWLYFCTARAVKMPVDYDKLKYSICRVAFDEQSGKLGSELDTVYSASQMGGSVSFPRLSPDGRYMLFTWADCATFPIHHKEADLKMMDLQEGGKMVDVSALNSNDVDSYHSWSSNGKWVVLSSKRIDGRYTRLFLAHWDGKRFSKPMLLPQREPKHNAERLFSYNIPEFYNCPVVIDKNQMAKLFDVGE